jgi:large subunit ribosomal protein L25
MATASLSATTRSGTGKGAARTLRRNGQVPGVIYGHNREAQPIAVNTREFSRLLERITAASTVIELSLDGKVARTLIREIQRHPYKPELLHVDFQELVAGETVTVKVPLVYTGTADGVRNGGGILDTVLFELEVEADPANIPSTISIDVTPLGIGRSLHARDISLPAGVTLVTDADATLCTIVPPKTHEAAPTEGASAEPEVLKKGKKEEE